MAILKSGFNAGSGYQQVWIRDMNTFIKYSLGVMPQQQVREALVKFLFFQGFDGNIADGYEELPEGHTVDNYNQFARYDMPGYAFHKNTVETDQETSLIQAVYKYITVTGDRTILQEQVHGRILLDRLEFALDYLMQYRFNKKYGLIWGATTTDWGDVQPLGPLGVKMDEYTTPAIDIYDNAMFLIALDNFINMTDNAADKAKWNNVHDNVMQHVREYLWDNDHQKFRPHIYILMSPFKGFDESKIYYHGGTAVAIEAGVLTSDEVLISLKKMREDMQAAGAQSIGLTLYPPYPQGSFENKGFGPYSYQNGGDWTWFGGRMITQLVRYGYVNEAYQEIRPMVKRVIENHGFYEWYTIEGKPNGSGTFRGSAGVLLEAIDMLENWAREHK